MTVQICLFRNRSLLRVTGADRVKFLNGLITNDINNLEQKPALYSCFLTPQGKYLTDFFVISYENSLLIDSFTPHAPGFLKKLSLYKLRSDVQLELLENAQIGAFRGKPKTHFTLAYPDPRSPDIGSRFINLEAAPLKPNWVEEDYVEDCLSLCLPFPETDLIPEKTIMLEANMEELGAISWSKGCYMGQELTARTKYRGLVRKKLFALKFEAPLPEEHGLSQGMSILYDSKIIGEMRSIGKQFAIAQLRLDEVAEIQRKSDFINVGGHKAKISK